MEHASTGAGADYNPVKTGMTNVLSCPWVQSQHFWDGLRKKENATQMQIKHFITTSSITYNDYRPPYHTTGCCLAMASVQNLRHTESISCLWSIKCMLPKKTAQWISCPWCCAVPRPACRMRWLVPNLRHAGSHCDVGGCRWGQQHCWKEYIRAPDYWAQSGKPGGGNT